MREGARQALSCLNLEYGENLVVVADKETLDIARCFIEEAEKFTNSIKFFVLEDFGERPLLHYPDAIRKALEEADVSVYTASHYDAETQTFRLHMMRTIESRNVRHAHMPADLTSAVQTGMLFK